ncbi:glutathione S-transferase-like isoform X2 [Onthophagus taurus]|uniref:glutathione S-transferase-like isoform X2 n=1 Tax=Onthophagus taurus TaxID=166361 RepID=UPI000C2002FA|nr:glutathione S-transferase-like [Onthophagus taurus]
MSEIKITYFPVKALAEPIRMLLKYGNINFDDNRFQQENWPNIKPDMPFGQVPIYEEAGRIAHQSIAITRYVAKKVKLVGDSDWENLEIDSVVDTINDLRQKIAYYWYEQDAAVKESRKGPLIEETLPFYLTRLESIAEKNNGHFALKKLTWADIYFTGLLDYLNFMLGTNMIEKYPNLQAVANNVRSVPAIKSWIETRPQSDL